MRGINCPGCLSEMSWSNSRSQWRVDVAGRRSSLWCNATGRARGGTCAASIRTHAFSRPARASIGNGSLDHVWCNIRQLTH